MVNYQFAYNVFTDTGGDYDRLVVSDGESMIEVRLTPGTAHIQKNGVCHEGVDMTKKYKEVKEFVSGKWADKDSVYIV